ncbi:PXA domain-containing protein [Ampelomyces quisqualis]|uniref:PXA domain-containing protein n=1 Tax=Ampelomyces quisqualis TaxID=50730 RepID=A0A6A5QVV5_AMPQU|nr:PXA domain-containing protein [Ampelomyces quisqualis]
MSASTHQAPDSPSLSPQALHQPNSVSTGSEQLHPLRNNGATRVVDTPKIQTDSTSDKATAAFVRRTLCSHNVLLGNGEKGLTTPRPIEEVLPPLTSSNDIDLQLYGIISVIIKEFVQNWYSKITPDHVFVNEVLQTIAHCTRGFEQRLRKVDLEALLLDELPELLENHLNYIRLAKQQASNSHALASDYRLIYHTLHPHPALSPVPTESVPSTIVEQRENESAWRQLLIQGVLAVLLPTEDLENGCLRALVAEIFAEMILGNGISGKACEGWLLCEGITSITKVLHTDAAKEEDVQPNSATPEQSMTRIEQYGLLSTGPQAQLGSINQPTLKKRSHKMWPVFLSRLFWMFVQYVLWASAAVRGAMLIFAASSSLPSRSTNHELSPAEASIQPQAPAGNAPSFRRPSRNKRPVVSMKLWSCMAQVVEMSVRMPWLWGTVSMLHWGLLMGPGKVGDTDGILDR